MRIRFALALGAVAVNGYTLPTLPPQQHAPINIKMALDLAALGVDGTPLAKTVKGFQLVPDQKLRYQQLLFLAKKLAPMDEALMTEENRVPGCLSVVHVHATRDGDLIRLQLALEGRAWCETRGRSKRSLPTSNSFATCA